MPTDDTWTARRRALGEFIRTQRRMANLSLRDLAGRTSVSNPYLSQIERGLHEPSVRVLKAIAAALNLSAETLLSEAGFFVDAAGLREGERIDTASAIRTDPALTTEQKNALIAVYNSYRIANIETGGRSPTDQARLRSSGARVR